MQHKENTQILKSFLSVLPQGINIIDNKILETSSKIEKIKRTRILKGDKNMNGSQIENYKKMQTLILGDDVKEDIKDQINAMTQTLIPQYQLGNQLEEVTGVERIGFDDDQSFNSSFQTQNGIIYVITIWASWCGASQVSMDKNQKILDKNPQWNGKVKFVGISIDDETEDVVKKVNQKKWKSIEYYRFINGEDNDLIKFIGMKDTPFMILINKWNKIVYMGNAATINFEERINNEINSQQDVQYEEQEAKYNQNSSKNDILTKQEFKQLKEKIANIEKAIKDSSFHGLVNVCLEKINVWKPDGTKDVVKRSRLMLSYDLQEIDEDKLNKFLQNHWDSIPANLRYVKEGKISGPERLKKLIQQKVYEIFTAMGVVIDYINYETNTYTYDKKIQQLTFKINHGFSVKAQYLTLDTLNFGLDAMDVWFYELELSEMNQLHGIYNQMIQDLKSHYYIGEGQQFETIEDYKKLDSDEYTSIEHIPGQVLLIDYWAEWQKPSSQALEVKCQILKKNAEKWGKNVRCVTLSLAQLETAYEFIESKKDILKYTELYFQKERGQSDCLKYKIMSFPHNVIVDKFGTIRKTQNVRQLENLVNQLLSEQTSTQEAELSHNLDLSKIHQIIMNGNNIIAQIDPQKILEFELVLTSNLIGDQTIFQKPKLIYFARDTQLEQLQNVFTQLFQLIPENSWRILKTISSTISVPYPGNNCAVCKKNIINEPQQYYSPFKLEHVCTECAESVDLEKQGNQRYKYLDTLIFINGPLSDKSVLSNIDDHKIGQNMKLQDGQQGNQYHSFDCNGCGKGEQGPRYISLNAIPGKYQDGGYLDFCQLCFLYLKDKTSQRAKQIVAQNAQYGMILDSLFTRVLFNYGGYQAF